MRAEILTFLRCGSYFTAFCIACLTELLEIPEVSFGNQIFETKPAVGLTRDGNYPKPLKTEFLE